MRATALFLQGPLGAALAGRRRLIGDRALR